MDAETMELLVDLGACEDAREWVDAQPDAEAAWAACERGDWMLWLAGRLSGPPGSESRRRLVLAACDCAELARPHVPAAWRDRIWPAVDQALHVARSWARRVPGVTPEDVRRAGAAAYAAAAYAAGLVDDATWLAATAADAAAATAWVDAAYVAGDAAAAIVGGDAAIVDGDAAADAARPAMLRACAHVVRAHYPEPPKRHDWMPSSAAAGA